MLSIYSLKNRLSLEKYQLGEIACLLSALIAAFALYFVNTKQGIFSQESILSPVVEILAYYPLAVWQENTLQQVFIKLIGLLVFVRGCFLVYNLNQSHYPTLTLYYGIVYVFEGIFLINLIEIMNLIALYKVLH